MAKLGPNGATCRTSKGEPCKGRPLTGATTCRFHTPNPKARANAAVRAEVARWDQEGARVDPGESLLRLLSQSTDRVTKYSALLEHAYNADRDGTLVGPVYGVTGRGERVETGEAVRALVRLEADERDRQARFAKLALDAGLEERRVRIAEAHAQTLVTVIEATLRQLGVDVNSPDVRTVVYRQLQAVEG